MYLGQFQKYYIQPPPPNPNIKALQKLSHFFLLLEIYHERDYTVLCPDPSISASKPFFDTSASRLIRRASAIPQRWIRLLYWWPPPPPQPPPPHPRPLPNLIYPGVEICQVSARMEMVYIFPIWKNRNFFL